MNTATADLADLLTTAGVPWYLNRWCVATIDLPGGEYQIRITEEEGTFDLSVLSGGRAQLIHTEARFSGIAAQVAILATIDVLITELAS